MTAYMGYLIVVQALRQFDRNSESLLMEWPLWPSTAVYALLILIGAALFSVRAWHDKDAEKKIGA